MDRVVVIGASAGGLAAMEKFLPALPARFPAPLLVVVHTPPDGLSPLPRILGSRPGLPARDAVDGESLEPGRIYVAVPDHHLMVDRERVLVRRGTRENGFRPSIDALFRSAALAWGSRAIAVVLSGAMDDGTSGLAAINSLNGVTVVQDPADAEYATMPTYALRRAAVDHVAAARDMARLLESLAASPARAEPPDAGEQRDALKLDMWAASGISPWSEGIMNRTATPYTCPECHGVMFEIGQADHRRFRCHTGHGYTAESLLPAIEQSSEDRVWEALRTLQEAATLMRETAETLERAGDAGAAQAMRDKLDAAQGRIEVLRRLTLGRPLPGNGG